MTDRPPLPWQRRVVHHSWFAALVAVGISGVLHVGVMMTRGIYPFGSLTRGQGDYFTQYLAFHSEFRRALVGDSMVDLQFTWASGAGVPFYGDVTNYIGGPFPFILALFPESLVELGLTTMVLLQAVVAAAAMAGLLRNIAPGSNTLLAGVFGALYSCCAWVFEMALYTPQWMNGLIAFPALCLVSVWAFRRKHLMASVAIVAVVLWSNYYTAYMGIVGSVLFLVVWLVGASTAWRDVLGALLRFAIRGVLGVGLAAAALLPTALILVASTGSPSPPLGSYPIGRLALRLLPGTSGIAYSPALFTGTILLLLAVSIPLSTASTRRERLLWWGSLIALGVTSALSPSVLLVWSAFISPHGSPYRFAFVIAGWITITAWKALYDKAQFHWPQPRQVALAGVFLALIFAIIPRTFEPHEGLLYIPLARLYIDPSLFIYPVLALGGFAMLASRGQRTRMVAVVALLAITATEVVLTGAFIDRANRDFLLSTEPYSRTSQETIPAARAATFAAQWPTHRVGNPLPERQPFHQHANVSARDGFPGVSYTSSMMPTATSQAFLDLGMPYASAGRMLGDGSGQVADAIFSIGARYDTNSDTVVESSALPLVRTYKQPAQDTDDVFSARENLLPQPVYRSAEVSTTVQAEEHHLRVSCTEGDIVSIDSSTFVNQPIEVEESAESLGSDYSSSSGVREYLAPVTFRFSGAAPASDVFRCHDSKYLATSVSAVETPHIAVNGNTFSATFDTAQEGQMVVATTATPGWQCRLDGQKATVGNRQGFLAVEASGQKQLDCHYTQPGLTLGLAISGLSALGLIAWAGGTVVLSRRRSRPAP